MDLEDMVKYFEGISLKSYQRMGQLEFGWGLFNNFFRWFG